MICFIGPVYHDDSSDDDDNVQNFFKHKRISYLSKETLDIATSIGKKTSESKTGSPMESGLSANVDDLSSSDDNEETVVLPHDEKQHSKEPYKASKRRFVLQTRKQ